MAPRVRRMSSAAARAIWNGLARGAGMLVLVVGCFPGSGAVGMGVLGGTGAARWRPLGDARTEPGVEVGLATGTPGLRTPRG